jgi:hypothetical protein
MLELLASSPTISVGSAREDKSRHSFSPGSWVVSRDSRQECSWSLEFGDPGEVEEIRYPEILGGTGIVLCAYPIERTLAEKIATMMERGELNTRDRDFADVWVLSRIHTIGAVDLRATLPKTDGRVLRTRTPPAPEPARPRDHQQRPNVYAE